MDLPRLPGAGPVGRLLHPGDVDRDIQLLLRMDMPYTGRALTGATCLFLSREDFEHLLATRPPVARRWLSSVAQRLAHSQARILGLLGGSLTAQAARLLAGEATGGRVELPQRTLAAMLGVQRPPHRHVHRPARLDHSRLPNLVTGRAAGRRPVLRHLRLSK
jgi:CRP-like cAMP-binding protein